MNKILILLLLLPVPVLAELSPMELMGLSVGTWEGELYYLDYQSGQRFGIPMSVTAELTPDDATLVRRLTYTDPGALVHAVSLVTVDRDTGELVETYFREGKGELFRYEIDDIQLTNDTNWTLVYSHQGIDDDRPARLRHTIERNGDTLTSSKEVRFLNQDGDYILRNGTKLKLLK